MLAANSETQSNSVILVRIIITKRSKNNLRIRVIVTRKFNKKRWKRVTNRPLSTKYLPRFLDLNSQRSISQRKMKAQEIHHRLSVDSTIRLLYIHSSRWNHLTGSVFNMHKIWKTSTSSLTELALKIKTRNSIAYTKKARWITKKSRNLIKLIKSRILFMCLWLKMIAISLIRIIRRRNS